MRRGDSRAAQALSPEMDRMLWTDLSTTCNAIARTGCPPMGITQHGQGSYHLAYLTRIRHNCEG
jgi:hypothetical protein